MASFSSSALNHPMKVASFSSTRNRPLRVAIAGHSQIRRLEREIHGNNFRVRTEEVQVTFLGRGGLKDANLIDQDVISPIIDFQPDALVLLIGDNDIYPSSSPQDICDDILDTVNSMLISCPSIRFVSLSQILPRYPGTSRYLFDGYNDIAYSVNNRLLLACISSPILRLYRYREFCFEEDSAVRFANNSRFFVQMEYTFIQGVTKNLPYVLGVFLLASYDMLINFQTSSFIHFNFLFIGLSIYSYL